MLSLGRRRRQRGQSLVEFALILPILMMLLLGAIDFGRIYLGYINLQNMTRIAASYAAANPDAWGSPGDATAQAGYRAAILRDTAPINCDLPSSGITDPVFSGKEVGDTATVSITCKFHLLTLVAGVFPDSVLDVTSTSVYPVRTGMIASAGGGTGPCILANPHFSVYDSAGSLMNDKPFLVGQQVHFSDESGGAPTDWLWDFGDPASASNSASTRDTAHAYTTAGAYTATLKVGNSCGWTTQTFSRDILVGDPPTTWFDWTPKEATAPADIAFADASTPTPVAWAWDFGDPGASNTSSAPNPTHHFATKGDYTVKLTTTSATGAISSVVRIVHIGEKICTVPYFVGDPPTSPAMTMSMALTAYSTAGFTGTLSTTVHGSHNTDWTIKWQSLVGGSQTVCSASIEVRNTVK